MLRVDRDLTHNDNGNRCCYRQLRPKWEKGGQKCNYGGPQVTETYKFCGETELLRYKYTSKQFISIYVHVCVIVEG